MKRLLTSLVVLLIWSVGAFAQADGALLKTGGAVANIAAAPFVLDSGEQFVVRISNASDTANSIYTRIYPGVRSVDAVQGVTKLLSGSNIGQTAAVAGYLRNQSAVNGIDNNGVALFGAGTCEVSFSACWGANTLIQDSAIRAVGSLIGIVAVGHEADFNIMNSGTQVIGVSVGGNSLAQSTNALGFIVNSLGTGIKWSAGFISVDGAANIGISLGKLAPSGVSNPSQPLIFQYSDNGGVARNIGMSAQSDFLVLSGTGTQFNLKISSGSLFLDQGRGIIIDGKTVLTERKPGWGAPVGALSRGPIQTDYTQAIASSYSQAQVQAIQNTLTEARMTLGALITDLRGHGLIQN